MITSSERKGLVQILPKSKHRDMTTSKGVPELRQFLGMINYLGRFLPNLSTTLSPISELLKSDTGWTWDSINNRKLSRKSKK